ncbi:unnamed protein product [Mytilus coruscus]|uniref:HAT C-terminal dimerisation domain-containing protein n=1 Tax=Mytilus coruscus TaxID=42192 RepID=A0A6J8DYE6_MYTCO|nr:unnamed protein product [Mytilus coruscus]
MKLYCFFVLANVGLFDTSNKLLQNDKPCIHILYEVLLSLFEKLLCRFVKAGVMSTAKSVLSFDFLDRTNQKDDANLFIGKEARDFVAKYGNIVDLAKFYTHVRVYYESICSYMAKKFPFGDEVLKNATVADIISKQDAFEFFSVELFLKRFMLLSNLFAEKNSKDDLEMEFIEYQVDKLPEEILSEERLDVQWHLLSQIKDVTTGKSKYGNLVSFMLAILVIFHSNVECEWTFSLVTKNKTKYRPNMTTKTLSSLISHKIT